MYVRTTIVLSMRARSWSSSVGHGGAAQPLFALPIAVDATTENELRRAQMSPLPSNERNNNFLFSRSVKNQCSSRRPVERKGKQFLFQLRRFLRTFSMVVMESVSAAAAAAAAAASWYADLHSTTSAQSAGHNGGVCNGIATPTSTPTEEHAPMGSDQYFKSPGYFSSAPYAAGKHK